MCSVHFSEEAFKVTAAMQNELFKQAGLATRIRLCDNAVPTLILPCTTLEVPLVDCQEKNNDSKSASSLSEIDVTTTDKSIVNHEDKFDALFLDLISKNIVRYDVNHCESGTEYMQFLKCSIPIVVCLQNKPNCHPQ